MSFTAYVMLDRTFHDLIAFIAIFTFSLVYLTLTYTPIKAPYGKFQKAHLPKINISVHPTPAWFIQELPCVLWCIYNFFFSPTRNLEATSSLTNQVLLSFFLFHYCNRSFVYPILVGRSGNPFSLIVLMGGMVITTTMGYVVTMEFTHLNVYPTSWLYSPQFLIGSVCFFLGFYWNNQADAILRSLRKPGEKKEYKIPRRGMFEYVSGANYFSEILEWTGFAIACCNFGTLTFLLITLGNLIPRGVQYHRWYLEKFKDYPKNRKAIIPFVY